MRYRLRTLLILLVVLPLLLWFAVSLVLIGIEFDRTATMAPVIEFAGPP